jgi:cyanophycinase
MKNTSLKLLISSFLLIFLICPNSAARPTQATNVGPAKGWLILHGGSMKQEYQAYHRLADLVGGGDAPVVVILTPVDIEILTPDFLTYYKNWWKTELGLTNVTFMDTRKREEADTETFVAPLRTAKGVWIMGGHLSTLLTVYLGTRTEREIKAVVDRGGVLAGSSAGAMIQGSLLISLTKSPSQVHFSRNGMYLDPTRTTGFGLLRNVTVYPHMAQRHSERDVVELLERYPDLLGIGLDENTAAVVHNDQFEVIGEGRVVIFENKNGSAKKYRILTKGQKFDLKTRTIIN